jgi:hypothetical protein
MPVPCRFDGVATDVESASDRWRDGAHSSAVNKLIEFHGTLSGEDADDATHEQAEAIEPTPGRAPDLIEEHRKVTP